jgi:signal transduction histidine kinase
MAATVAHEVRNPLAGIRGAIQVIGLRLPAGTREAAIVPEILARVDSLAELMSELLLFSRAPRLEKTALDITALVTKTAALLKQDPSLAELRVEVAGGGVTVMADGRLMDIVFRNLLLNSAQALRGRGRIQVAVQALGDVCQIAVADNGPGIPVELRDRIFAPFFTTKRLGTGLGLAITRRLVEAHGGSIGIEFPPASGTSVIVQLPLRGT